ncbi:MAG: T9SS type A sorting domain-containing protein [Bacteroidia bacterium]|nr:T9SS type A sorting domain-containing protein [Bacteroidia bacterium]
MRKILYYFVLIIPALLNHAVFSQTTTKPVTQMELEYYLSKSVVAREVNELLKTSNGYFNGVAVVDSSELAFWQTYGDRWEILSGKEIQIYQDVIRLIGDCGSKFVFEIGVWTMPYNYSIHLNRCKLSVEHIKAEDSTIIVAAAVYEYVDEETLSSVGTIPDWVFDAFNLPPPATPRNFNIYDMAYDDYQTNPIHVHSNGNSSNLLAIVPDISKVEAQMWMYFQGRNYINAGCESLNFNQIRLMNEATGNDLYPDNWNIVFDKLRAYNDTLPPSHRFLLITGDANGLKDGNQLLLDFNNVPSRTHEYGQATNINGGSCIISEQSCLNTIYTQSIGGITPSGWNCTAIPQVVSLDNYGGTDGNINLLGQNNGVCSYFPYHFDEITWFAMQPESFRNAWIPYAYYKVRCISNGVFFFSPTITRHIIPARYMRYYANNPQSGFLPAPILQQNVPLTYGSLGGQFQHRQAGYGQEQVISDLFSGVFDSPNPCMNNSIFLIEPDFSDIPKNSTDFSEITIHPNPAHTYIEIEIGETETLISSEIRIRIWNSIGDLVTEITEKRINQITIPISGFSNGVYRITVNDDKGRIYASNLIIE